MMGPRLHVWLPSAEKDALVGSIESIIGAFVKILGPRVVLGRFGVERSGTSSCQWLVMRHL